MAGTVFVSVDDFTREGFTNGLFLQVREILQRVTLRARPAGLACIAQCGNPGVERRTRTVRGCTVHETLIGAPAPANAYRRALQDLLNDLDPDVILLNSCAVRLNEAHLAVLDESLASGRRVAVLVTDQLYPTSHGHPADEVRRYYDLMRQAGVHAVSQTVADAFYSQTVDAIDHDAALRARLVANGRAFVRDYRKHSEAVTGRLLDTWFETA